MPAIQISRSPSRSELLVFGLVVLLFFGIVGGIAWWQFSSPDWARRLWIAGAVLAGVFYALPPLRLPIYLLWMHAVAPLGWLISHAILAIIYYGIITPMALIMRLFGRDTMGRRFEPDLDSYWNEHDPGGDKRRYLRQS